MLNSVDPGNPGIDVSWSALFELEADLSSDGTNLPLSAFFKAGLERFIDAQARADELRDPTVSPADILTMLAPHFNLTLRHSNDSVSIVAFPNSDSVPSSETAAFPRPNLEISETDVIFWAFLLSDFPAVSAKVPKITLHRLRHTTVPWPLQSRVWRAMCGAQNNQDLAGLYHALLEDMSPVEAQIERDADRIVQSATELPSHGPNSVQSEQLLAGLKDVLKAFSIFDPRVGYSRSLANFTAMLLRYLDPLDTFCVLVRCLELNAAQNETSARLPHTVETLFAGGVGKNAEAGLRARVFVFNELFKAQKPALYRHLHGKLGLKATSYFRNWAATLFAATVSGAGGAGAAEKVLDLLFLDGLDYALLRLALALIAENEAQLLAITELDEAVLYLNSRSVWRSSGATPTEAVATVYATPLVAPEAVAPSVVQQLLQKYATQTAQGADPLQQSFADSGRPEGGDSAATSAWGRAFSGSGSGKARAARKPVADPNVDLCLTTGGSGTSGAAVGSTSGAVNGSIGGSATSIAVGLPDLRAEISETSEESASKRASIYSGSESLGSELMDVVQQQITRLEQQLAREQRVNQELAVKLTEAAEQRATDWAAVAPLLSALADGGSAEVEEARKLVQTRYDSENAAIVERNNETYGETVLAQLRSNQEPAADIGRKAPFCVKCEELRLQLTEMKFARKVKEEEIAVLTKRVAELDTKAKEEKAKAADSAAAAAAAANSGPSLVGKLFHSEKKKDLGFQLKSFNTGNTRADERLKKTELSEVNLMKRRSIYGNIALAGGSSVPTMEHSDRRVVSESERPKSVAFESADAVLMRRFSVDESKETQT